MAKPSRSWTLIALAAGILACGERDDALRVEKTRVGDKVQLTLIASPFVQISAQLKPTLELSDGTRLQFDSPHLNSDSTYFTAAPELVVPAEIKAEGKIRASVCDSGQAYCRLATLTLR